MISSFYKWGIWTPKITYLTWSMTKPELKRVGSQLSGLCTASVVKPSIYVTFWNKNRNRHIELRYKHVEPESNNVIIPYIVQSFKKLAYLVKGRVIIRLFFILWEFDMQSCCIFSIWICLNSSHWIQHFFKFI